MGLPAPPSHHRNPPKHQRLHPRLPPLRLPRLPLRKRPRLPPQRHPRPPPQRHPRPPLRNPRSHAHVTCASLLGKKPEEIAKEVSLRNSCAKARLLKPSPNAGSKNASSPRKHVLRSHSPTSTTSKNINCYMFFASQILEDIFHFLLLIFNCSKAKIRSQPRICLFVSNKQSSL